MAGEAKADGGGPVRTTPKASLAAARDPTEETAGILPASLVCGDVS